MGFGTLSCLRPMTSKKFLGDNRVVHVYGKVREDPFERPTELTWSEQGRDPNEVGTQRDQYLMEYKKLLDTFYTASQGIHVIDPQDKTTNKEVFAYATDAITAAQNIYILGYGFDENNSDRLELPKLLHCQRTKQKSVFLTNFGDINRVNKRASKIFFGGTNRFPPGVMIEVGGDNRYEKSVRDVYEALELDFDSFA
jgi:hypothetical protein